MLLHTYPVFVVRVDSKINIIKTENVSNFRNFLCSPPVHPTLPVITPPPLFSNIWTQPIHLFMPHLFQCLKIFKIKNIYYSLL